MVPFHHILVPTDFGEPSDRAVAFGIQLAKQFGAELSIVHAYEVPTYLYTGLDNSMLGLLGPIEEAAREQLDRVLFEVRKEVPAAQGLLRSGVAWHEILNAIAGSKADLVIMGTHGRRGVTHALLGSVAERIVRLSPVPVLTVRAP